MGPREKKAPRVFRTKNQGGESYTEGNPRDLQRAPLKHSTEHQSVHACEQPHRARGIKAISNVKGDNEHHTQV